MALRALKIDPQAPDALAALGQVAQYYDRDERTALRYFTQAIDSNSRSSSLRIFMAWHYFLFGHLENAHEQLEYVLAAEPDSSRAHFSLAMVSLYEEDFELAVAMLRTVKDASPGLYLPQFYLGTILAETGEPHQALQIFAGLPESFLPRFTRPAVAHAHAAAGNVAEARRILHELEQVSKEVYVSHYYLARAYAALRDDGMLRSALLRADKDADPWLIFLRAHPYWKRYRNDRLIARVLQPRSSAATAEP